MKTSIGNSSIQKPVIALCIDNLKLLHRNIGYSYHSLCSKLRLPLVPVRHSNGKECSQNYGVFFHFSLDIIFPNMIFLLHFLPDIIYCTWCCCCKRFHLSRVCEKGWGVLPQKYGWRLPPDVTRSRQEIRLI